jgi:hypothetical protein
MRVREGRQGHPEIKIKINEQEAKTVRGFVAEGDRAGTGPF